MQSKTTPTPKTTTPKAKAAPKTAAKPKPNAARTEPTPSEVSAQKKARVIKALEAGKSPAEVAKAEGYKSTARVHAIRRQAGLAPAQRSTWQSDERRDQAHAAVQQLADVADALGVTPARVLRRVEREAETA